MTDSNIYHCKLSCLFLKVVFSCKPPSGIKNIISHVTQIIIDFLQVLLPSLKLVLAVLVAIEPSSPSFLVGTSFCSSVGIRLITMSTGDW